MQITVSMYQRRFGVRSNVEISFERGGLRVKPDGMPADGSFLIDPKTWSSTGPYGGLTEWLSNDGIEVPMSFLARLVGVWLQWNAGKVDEAEASRVMALLFGWLDLINESDPSRQMEGYPR